MEYEVKSIQLITDEMANIPGLAIAIYDQPVKNLTTSTINLYNSGNQTIYTSDFAAKEPLEIAVSGYFLDAKYGHHISTSNSNSDAVLKIIKGDTIAIEFDFLKPKESIKVKVLHDGNISIRGELTDGKFRKHRDRYRIFPIAFSVFAVATSLFLEMLGNHSQELLDEAYPTLAVFAITATLFDLIRFYSKRE